MNIVISSEGKEIVMKLITDNSDLPEAPETVYRIKIEAPEGYGIFTFEEPEDNSYKTLVFEPQG